MATLQERNTGGDAQASCKKLLLNKLFVGNYRERRYVEALSTYRDVVVIHKSESDLKKDLEVVKERLHEICPRLWFGFTAFSADDRALWVRLTDLPFGHYWFQVKQVKFEHNQVSIRLKVIRSVGLPEPTEDVNCKAAESNATDWSDAIPSVEDCTQSLGEWRSNVKRGLRNHVTYENVKLAACFVGALLVAAVTGFVHLVQFAGDFSLRFMREASIFIQAMTPIMLSVMDFITKLVGGFYILLAMLWRGKPHESRYPNYRPALQAPLRFKKN